MRALRAGELAPTELVEAALARHGEVEPAVNAVPTLCAERAREFERGVAGATLLGGLPTVVKDLHDVEGMRTTYGSIIFADHVPDRTDVSVQRQEAAGAVVLGKSNTPATAPEAPRVGTCEPPLSPMASTRTRRRRRLDVMVERVERNSISSLSRT